MCYARVIFICKLIYSTSIFNAPHHHSLRFHTNKYTDNNIPLSKKFVVIITATAVASVRICRQRRWKAVRSINQFRVHKRTRCVRASHVLGQTHVNRKASKSNLIISYGWGRGYCGDDSCNEGEVIEVGWGWGEGGCGIGLYI